MKINIIGYIRNMAKSKKQIAADAGAIGFLFLVLLMIGVNAKMLASVLVPLSGAVLLLEVHAHDRRIVKNQIDELLLVLHATLINLQGKKPVRDSIKNALDAVDVNSAAHADAEGGAVARIFNRIIKELEFHDIRNAIDSAINRSMKSTEEETPMFLSAALSNIANDYKSNLDICISVKNAYKRAQAMKINMQNRHMNSVRKFFTLGIVLTTVVPSIMLFGFIAYSMIFYSYGEFMMFSIMLAGVFPCVYMILQMQISGA